MDNRITCLIGVLLAAVALCAAQKPYVGGYVLLSRVSRNGQIVGLPELAALADQAATIPVSRLWLSFFAPTMVYYQRSYTLEHSRLNVSNSGDFGFAAIQASVRKLQVCVPSRGCATSIACVFVMLCVYVG